MEHHEELHWERTLQDPHAGEGLAQPGSARKASQAPARGVWPGQPPPTPVAVCGMVLVTLTVINDPLKLAALIFARDLVCFQIT